MGKAAKKNMIKMMSIPVNFLNLWLGPSDQSTIHEKNCEAQFLENKMLKS